jgi:hypothetical protein
LISFSFLTSSFITSPLTLAFLPPCALPFCPPLFGIVALVGFFALLFAKERARVFAFSFDIF